MGNKITLFKDLEYYEENKKYFNRHYNDVTKKYIGVKRIGRCSFLYKKYKTNDYQEFANKYFDDYVGNDFNTETLYGDENYGRSINQLTIIANKLKEELKDDVNVTLEMCLDLLITHTIIETIDGHIVENEVIDYLKRYDKFIVNNEIDEIDSNFNVDITVRNKLNNALISYIQVKPISTFLSNSEGVRKDRVNFFKKQMDFNRYLTEQNKTEDIKEIDYMVYDIEPVGKKHKFLINPKTNKKTFKLNELTDENGNVILKRNELSFEFL